MKILMVEPGKAPKEKNISGTLDSMQEAVGGTIQAIYPFDEPVALICNDDGKLMNLPMCRSIHEIGDIIFGSFFVCAAHPGIGISHLYPRSRSSDTRSGSASRKLFCVSAAMPSLC